MISPIDVFITVFSLVLLIIPGFILAKTKLLGEGADKALSNVVLYCAQPLLVFTTFQKKFESEIAVNLVIVLALALVIHLLMLGFVYLVIRNRSKDPKKDAARFASLFGNVGYLGIPFIQTLYKNMPEQMGLMLVYCSSILFVFNIFNWTVGVVMYSHDKKDVSPKKILLNPTIIGCILGFLMFFVIQKPMVDWAGVGVGVNALDSALEKIMDGLNSLAQLVTPLSMIVIGMKLSQVKIKDLFTSKLAYFASFNKLIVMSLITILCVIFLPIDVNIKNVLFFTLSMPSAAATTLFAVRFKGDGKIASIMVLLSTILSVFTITIMYYFYTLILGVL